MNRTGPYFPNPTGGGMFKGVLVALGIIIVSALIPIVHFIALPASPFIGGYVGINYAGFNPERYAMKGLQFGSLLGLVVFIVAAATAGAVTFMVDPTQKVRVVMWIGVAVFTLYSGSMSTLGAMYSSLRSRPSSDAVDAAEQGS
jgi:hypothetical protein